MEDSDQPQAAGNSYRVIKCMTAAAFLIIFMNGIMIHLINPVRYDIADQLNSSLKEVSYGPMARAVGIGIGSLSISFILTRVKRQVVDVSVVTAAGLTVLIVPFTRSLWQYLLTEVMTGSFNAMHGSNRNSWLLEMWGSRANPAMQALHAIFGLGSAVAPLIVAPFLSDRNSTDVYRRQSHIVIPYSLVSAIVFCVAAAVAVLYHNMPYIDSHRKVSKGSTNEGRHTIKGPAAGNTVLYNRALIGLSCLFIGIFIGTEQSAMGFSAAFLYCLPLGFTKVDAAHITSAMNASFAVNRLISIYVATKISARNMLIGSFIVLLTGNVLLIVFANISQSVVWISFVLIGMGHSNVYAAFLSFAEERVNVTAGVVAAFSLSSCASQLIFPFLVGQWLEEFPLIYIIVSLFGLLASACAFIGILFLDHRFPPTSQ